MAYTLNTRNQVKLPHNICAALGVKPGDEIDYQIQLDGSVFITASSSQKLPQYRLKNQPSSAHQRPK
jgi:antitoxin component of MazEF toxin-antitoxin module